MKKNLNFFAQLSTAFYQSFLATPVLALAVTLAVLMGGSSSAAALSDTFHAVARLAPCHEYAEGRARLELYYRVGTNPALVPAAIVKEELAANNAGVTLHFLLPRTFGTTPLHLHAVCSGGGQRSGESNWVSISNCNFLATEDHDNDGLPSNLEDSNCNNGFDPADYSNLEHADSDGDGARDLVEYTHHSDPKHPGSSSRPFVHSGGPFDPNGDGNSNPVVWRPENGTWYIRDFYAPEAHLAVQFGLPGDTPFTYRNAGEPSNVGVIRQTPAGFLWLFNNPGLALSDGRRVTAQHFGAVGDHILPGAWNSPHSLTPAVARLVHDTWWFYVYRPDGTVTQFAWGKTGDFPMTQDYDGDGVFDYAVFRPSTNKVYVVRSSDSQGAVYSFGVAHGDYTVRGDFSGDGVDDISFWEPVHGMFRTGQSSEFYLEGAEWVPRAITSLQLGLYYAHLPLNWNRQAGRTLYTVVEHATGLRYARPQNDPSANPVPVQWGRSGDVFG